MTTTTEIRTELVWTPEAWDKYQEMGYEIERVRAYFGDGPANEMLRTFTMCLHRLFTCGPSRITKAFDFDGLNVYTEYIAMGVVFFPDTVTKMKERLARYDLHFDGDEFQPDWPRTGEWSLHS